MQTHLKDLCMSSDGAKIFVNIYKVVNRKGRKLGRGRKHFNLNSLNLICLVMSCLTFSLLLPCSIESFLKISDLFILFCSSALL